MHSIFEEIGVDKMESYFPILDVYFIIGAFESRVNDVSRIVGVRRSSGSKWEFPFDENSSRGRATKGKGERSCIF